MVGVDLLVLDGASAAAVGATIDMVSAANRILGEPMFELRIIAAEPTIRLRGDLQAIAQPLHEVTPREAIILPGLGTATPQEIHTRLASPDIATAADWLNLPGVAGMQIGASCTAVFVLAAAGLLTGRRCVTTWWLGAELGRVAADAEVVIDAMVVRDGPIWTAGASFAHIDLMLAVLRHFGGTTLTEELASRLLIDQRSSQATFLIPSYLAAHDDTVARLEAHVRAHLPQSHTLAELATTAGVSPRTLTRMTDRALGLSPLQLVARIRLQHAVHLLRTTAMSLEQITTAVGLSLDPPKN